jgi:hypothetical protein
VESLGFGDAVTLGGNDDVVYGILWLGNCVGVATEGATDIFGREEGAGVRVGMVMVEVHPPLSSHAVPGLWQPSAPGGDKGDAGLFVVLAYLLT